MGDRYRGQTPQDTCARGLLPLAPSEDLRRELHRIETVLAYARLYGTVAALVEAMRRSQQSGEPLEPDLGWWLAKLETALADRDAARTGDQDEEGAEHGVHG